MYPHNKLRKREKMLRTSLDRKALVTAFRRIATLENNKKTKQSFLQKAITAPNS